MIHDYPYVNLEEQKEGQAAMSTEFSDLASYEESERISANVTAATKIGLPIARLEYLERKVAKLSIALCFVSFVIVCVAFWAVITP